MAFGRKKSKDRSMSTTGDSALMGNNKIRSASFYVWYLGARECRSLRGDDQVVPWIEELADADATNGKKSKLAAPGKIEQPPMKLTIELSNKGMKLLQHLTRRKGNKTQPSTNTSVNPIAKVSFTTETVKHFIPSSCVTYVKQGAPPYDDIVGVILLIYNPLTRCPVHAHVYRCDSAKTAESMTRKLDKMSMRANNNLRDAQLVQLEARLQERGLLPAPPPLPRPPSPPRPVIPAMWRSYLPDPPELSMRMLQLQSTPLAQQRNGRNLGPRTMAEVLQNQSSSRYYLKRPEDTLDRKKDVEQPSRMKRYYLTPDYQRWYAIDREVQEVTQNFSDSDNSSIATGSSSSTSLETDVQNSVLRRKAASNTVRGLSPGATKSNTVFSKAAARIRTPSQLDGKLAQSDRSRLNTPQQTRGRLIIPTKDYDNDDGGKVQPDSWNNILENIRLRRTGRNLSSPPPDEGNNEGNATRMRRSASMQHRTTAMNGANDDQQRGRDVVAENGLGGSHSSSELVADNGLPEHHSPASHYETPRSILHNSSNKQNDDEETNANSRSARFSNARDAVQRQILTFSGNQRTNSNGAQGDGDKKNASQQRFPLAAAHRTGSVASSGYSSTSPIGGNATGSALNQNNNNSQIVAEPTVKPSSLLRHAKSMHNLPHNAVINRFAPAAVQNRYSDEVIPEAVPPLRAPEAFNQLAAAMKQQQQQTDRQLRGNTGAAPIPPPPPPSANAAYRPRHYYYNDDAMPTAAGRYPAAAIYGSEFDGVPLQYAVPYPMATNQPQQFFAMPPSPPRHQRHQHSAVVSQPTPLHYPLQQQPAYIVRGPGFQPHAYAPASPSTAFMPPTVMMATSTAPSYQPQRHLYRPNSPAMTYGHPSWQPPQWSSAQQQQVAPAPSMSYYPAVTQGYIVY